jgi:hypothetical protein
LPSIFYFATFPLVAEPVRRQRWLGGPIKLNTRFPSTHRSHHERPLC